MSPGGRRTFDWEEARQRLAEAHRAMNEEAAPDPERVRATLRERARELAREAVDSGADHDRELVTFGLAGGRFAIDSDRVLEIGRAREIAPLPGAPAPLLGVTPWRGTLLLLRDLAATLGHDVAYPERPLMVVLDGGDAPFGVPIAAVHEVLRVRMDEVGVVPEMIHTHHELITGVVQGDVMVLDGDALLRGLTEPA